MGLVNKGRNGGESTKEKVGRLLEVLNEGVSKVFESDEYRKFLTMMSRMHRYSYNNCLLIHLQKPEATLVAGYKAWQDKFNRNVKKGEKGIQILGGSSYRVRLSSDEGLEEESDENVRTGVRFFPTYVWDVSQTEGEPLPSVVTQLEGCLDNYEVLFEAIRTTAGVPVSFEEIQGGANGYYKVDSNKIVLRAGMSEVQTIKTLVHELAHARLHNKDESAKRKVDIRTKEVEAESVAFVVGSYLGIDVSSYSFGYIAGWSSGKGLDELKSSLGVIGKVASELINEISSEYLDIMHGSV